MSKEARMFDWMKNGEVPQIEGDPKDWDTDQKTDFGQWDLTEDGTPVARVEPT